MDSIISLILHFQDDNDEDDFESLDQDIDDEAEERQATANAKATQDQNNNNEEEKEEAPSTASWLGSRKYHYEKVQGDASERLKTLGYSMLQFKHFNCIFEASQIIRKLYKKVQKLNYDNIF